MSISKLQRSYNWLSEDEQKSFRRFVVYSFPEDRFKTHLYLNIVKLLEKDMVLTNNISEIATIVYGKKTSVKAIRRLLTNLYKSWERFCCLRVFEDERLSTEEGVAMYFKSRGNSDKTLSLLADQEVTLHKTRHSSAHRKLVENNLKQYNILSRRHREADLKIDSALEHLEQYVVAEYLKLSCLAKSHQHIAGQPYDLSRTKDILRWVSDDLETLSDDAQAYYHAHLIQSQPTNESTFQQLKEIILNSSGLSDDDRTNLLIFAINYCIDQANQGRQSFVEEALTFYTRGLVNGTLLNDGRLSKFTYRNIVSHGLALKKYDWARSFMEENKSLLDPANRENTFHYNLARYYFHSEDFDNALELLRSVEFDDVSYNVDAKRMLIKIFFTKKEWQALPYQLDSFKVYLLRHKKQIRFYSYYTRMIRNFRKSIQFEYLSRAKQTAVLKKMSDEQDFMDKKWLLRKLESYLDQSS